MKTHPLFKKSSASQLMMALRKKNGFALIIVLFFIVLLTALTVAYLARAIIARKVSDSSSSQAKAAVLANTAGEVVIGDLIQEIIDGSTIPTYTPPLPTGYNVYLPKPSISATQISTATPAIVGFTPSINAVSGQETDGLANLLKVSRRNLPFHPLAVTNPNYANPPTGLVNGRAAAVNSKYDVSLNGRYVSEARWNSHYLLGRLSTIPTAKLDSTPVAKFTGTNGATAIVPDWVLVARDGSNPVTNTLASPPNANGMNNPTPLNNKYVIGRYAYAIYNEGGLLDMNAAGYPTTLTTAQVGTTYKASVALADLTQLGAQVLTATPTATQINNLVGWRNSYSAQMSGTTFGSSSFPAANATNWLNNFVAFNTSPTNLMFTIPNGLPNAGKTQLASANGYMGVNTNTLATPASPNTDQAFLSRQQLIKLTQSLNISPDILQYLGTFSRSLEQPSYAPDPGRPIITNAGNPPPSVAPTDNANNYKGNNDAAGGDLTINPAFLSIRVTKTFTRLNGSKALIGEPLVKAKFPLSTLAMVAYNETNSTAKAKYQPTLNPAADFDPIKDRFGLTRANSSQPWVYDHGIKDTSSTPKTVIGTLDKVAAAGREPDFAELLKAAITVGSLAKGGPNFPIPADSKNPTLNLQYVLDTSVDTQVLQIMANLIDQQDKDSYPTQIQLAGGAPNDTSNPIVSGIEDLPYIYRYHTVGIVDRLPTPAFSNTSSPLSLPPITLGVTVTGKAIGPSVESPSVTPWTMTNASVSGAASWGNSGVAPNLPFTFYGAGQGTLSDSGEATQLLVVDLWNPHDPNCLANEIASGLPNNGRPTQFRISAATADPYYNGGANPNSKPPWTLVMFGDVSPNVPKSTYGDGSFGNFNRRAALMVPIAPLSKVVLTSPLTEGTNSTGNTAITITDKSGGKAFREPTLVWHSTPGWVELLGPTTPSGQLPTSTPIPTGGTKGMPDIGLPDAANTGSPNYFGFVMGQIPLSVNINLTGAVTQVKTPPATVPSEYQNVNYVFQGKGFLRYDPANTTDLPDTETLSGYGDLHYPANFPGTGLPLAGNAQITLMLEYQDVNGTWIPYQYQYPDLHGVVGSEVVVKTSDYPIAKPPNKPNTWSNMEQLQPGTDTTTFLPTSQMPAVATAIDPRTARWGMAKWGLGFPANINGGVPDSTFGGSKPLDQLLGTPNKAQDDPSDSGGSFSILYSQDPGGDRGFWTKLNNPSTAGSAANMGWFNVSNTFYGSALAFNNQSINVSGGLPYYEDADGILRRAMGAYNPVTPATLNVTPSGSPLGSGSPIPGMPLANAQTYSSPGTAGITTQQSQSRPYILNRPFRSVEEMSYAFTGTPWKNINFFTPESGDVGLLDVFCLSPPPTNGIVAGKVDLNTRQYPVLAALEAATYKDEAKNATSPPAYALSALSSNEARAVAQALIKYTTFTASPAVLWKGPLTNVSELVGKFVATPGTTGATATDAYTYNGHTYAGFSAELSNTGSPVFTTATSGTAATASATANIQRMNEAALRPLVDAGQTRVWNLLIDIVAQTGHYPKTSTGLSQFYVDGEKRIWLHVAIDRYTGQVIDKQVEVVAQ